MIKGRAFVFSFVGLALSSCSEPKVEPKASPEEKAEQVLLADPGKAIDEIKKRLHNDVVVEGGLVIVRDWMGSIQVFSSIPPWKIDCSGPGGLRLTFAFGASPEDHYEVWLTRSNPFADQCFKIMVPIAVEAKTLLSFHD